MEIIDVIWATAMECRFRPYRDFVFIYHLCFYQYFVPIGTRFHEQAREVVFLG
jgi:hypothetical protein